MQLFIRHACSRTIVIDVGVDDTIEYIKQKIEDKSGLPSRFQNLIFSGKYLYNDSRLCDFNISHSDTIQVHLRINGGRGD